MIILGVDPGTLITGYAVIESNSHHPRIITSNVIKINSSNKLPLRLKQIYDTLLNVIDKFEPDELAIETAFYSKNVQSTLKLGHARGVSILAAVNKNIPAVEYSPREVKKSVVGSGNASKEQVKFMVCRILKMKSAIKFFDVFDAAAVALCHHNRIFSNSTHSYKSWKEFLRDNPSRIRH
jgi:crossover junction endodeoxyribonuclease RuvC